MTEPVVNIDDLKLESWERGTLYGGADVRIGPMIGVKDGARFVGVLTPAGVHRALRESLR